MNLPVLRLAVLLFVDACWVVFGCVFLFHKRPPAAPESKRDRVSIVGIVLQGLSYALVWGAHRAWLTPLAPMPPALEITLAALTVILVAASVWMALAAVRTLGKQWAFAARLVEGHKLITEGPYSRVRNPIYTSMLGMLVATGLAVGRWQALAAALVLFGVGTIVRVRSEEKLLRGAFGAEFEDYARRVPAVFPRLY